MRRLLLTGVAVLAASAAYAAEPAKAPVDEYHHATAPVKATPKKGFALRNDVLRKQPAKVYLLENRGPRPAVDDKHDTKNW